MAALRTASRSSISPSHPTFYRAMTASRAPLSSSRVLAALDAAGIDMFADAVGAPAAALSPAASPPPTPGAATPSALGLSKNRSAPAKVTGPSLVDPKPIHPSYNVWPPPRGAATETAPGGRSALGRTVSAPAVAGPSTASAPEPTAPAATGKKAPVKRTVSRSKPSDYDPIERLMPTLPVYEYDDPALDTRPPAIVYTRHEDEADELLSALSGPLGFDMEWKVIWRRGGPPGQNKTALVQVADANMVVLVQISAMKKFPTKLRELVEDPNVMKLGANIKNDGEKLYRDFGIIGRGFVELGAIAHAADPPRAAPPPTDASGSTTPTPAHTGFPYTRRIVALAKVVALYTGRRLLKDDVRTSDWERPLDARQQRYAANDVHCALMVLRRLTQHAKNAGITLDLRPLAVGIAAATPKPVAVPAPAPAPAPAGGTSIVAANPAPSCSTAGAPSAPQTVRGASAPPASHTPSSGAGPPALRVAPNPAAYTSGVVPGEPPRPRHLEAYTLWHTAQLPLGTICATMRANPPLKESTVISYVIGALQANTSLPFDGARLRALVQEEAGSWRRHRDYLQLIGV